MVSPAGRRCTPWSRRRPRRNITFCSFELLIKTVEMDAESENPHKKRSSHPERPKHLTRRESLPSVFRRCQQSTNPQRGRKNSGNNQHFSRLFAACPRLHVSQFLRASARIPRCVVLLMLRPGPGRHRSVNGKHEKTF